MTRNAVLELLLPSLGTSLGAGCVFFLKERMNLMLRRALTGFAAGVMVAASVWSLLVPAMEQAESMGRWAFLPAVIGFWLGVLFLLALDRTIPHLHQNSSQPEGPHTRLKRTTMLVLAVTLHNIPEGMAVGLAFALAAQSVEDAALLSGAIALTLGIAIQNFPEGTAVALPLMNEGMSRKKAFLVASMTAIVEPVFGVIAATFVSFFKICIPVFLAFAAGTMIYVVVEELIPQAHMTDGESEGKEGTLGFIVGFLIMMILDVALG